MSVVREHLESLAAKNQATARDMNERIALESKNIAAWTDTRNNCLAVIKECEDAIATLTPDEQPVAEAVVQSEATN